MPIVDKRRCGWTGNATRKPPSDPLMIRYHDTEWGVPLHEDRKHFEFLVLDAFQAGLSWAIILKKREAFRRAFSDFDPVKIARYRRQSVERLLKDEGIVRNRGKIEATISNARAFLKTQDAFGSFDTFIWQFVGGKPKQNAWKSMSQLPAKTDDSEAMSKALRDRGFKFVGPTICYAYMQAAGMVNDHEVACFRYREIREMGGPG